MPINFESRDLHDYILHLAFESYQKTHRYYARGYFNRLINIPSMDDILKRINGKILRTAVIGYGHHFLIQREDAIFILYVNKPPSNKECVLSLEAISKKNDIAAKEVTAFREFTCQFKEQPSAETAKIIISHLDCHGGANFYERHLDCPLWKDIRNNYTGHDAIQELFELSDPYLHGRLVFWHGKPGTGKTFAVRALAQEWKHKAHFLYIVDPEAFFNVPGYMFQCLLHEFYDDEPRSRYSAPEPPLEAIADEDKIKVFVIEDALDFLLEEKRKEMSPAMSRLLNLTEGIIGQGFKLIILITSNEDVGKIDPAFMRPGRCLQRLEFTAFDSKQALIWLRANKIDKIPEEYADKSSWTLADLYAIKSGRALDSGKPSKPSVGFHR